MYIGAHSDDLIESRATRINISMILFRRWPLWALLPLALAAWTAASGVYTTRQTYVMIKTALALPPARAAHVAMV